MLDGIQENNCNWQVLSKDNMYYAFQPTQLALETPLRFIAKPKSDKTNREKKHPGRKNKTR